MGLLTFSLNVTPEFTASQGFRGDLTGERIPRGELVPDETLPAADLSVTYTNSRWDLVWFNLLMIFRGRPNQIALGIVVFWNGFMILSWTGWSPWGVAVFVVTTALVVAVIALLTVVTIFFGVSARRNRSVLTQHTVTLTAEGVLESTVFNRNQIYWRGVDRVVDAGGFVCVHPGQFSAYLIPGSAFQSEQARRDFVAFAGEQLRLARSAAETPQEG